MADKLIKIAKEFNVGTSTIVEYLNGKGFDIQNKPTSMVSDDMYTELLKEYSSSAEVKEKADKLVMNRTYAKQEEPKQAAPPPPPPPKPKEEPKVEPVPEKEEVVESKVEVPGLKIVGKIDLTPKPKVKKEEAKPVEEEPKVIEKVEEKVEEVKVEAKEEKKTEEPQKVEEILRAETPQLQGLKILGKIDTNKFNTKKKDNKKTGKTAPEPVKTKDAKPASTTTDTNDANKEKRKRKRKKVSSASINTRGDRPGGGKQAPKEEVREVTQKEIDDKIKATMARMSGSGKNKRQKIRRDNREEKREKIEAANEEATSDMTLKLTEFVSVSELASLMDVPVTEVITTCLNLGVMVSINQRLDAEIIELVANEFGHEVEFISEETESNEEIEEVDDPKDLVPRAPIVTVMGHVDHGKTSLLDFIRKANVVEGEAGGITQHIGAYEVEVGEEGRKITFLDTPGHEAFTAMRARGAKITDVVVVIVAADDRVMPQTKEAISHAQAAGVPIVFAINKIDKDGADPTRIKQELAGMNLLIDEWGGKIQSQDISAKTGLNVDLLLEKILLEADILDLTANPKKKANGTVIEASLDKGRGYITKLLVQNGTLNIGDPIVSGSHSGKIKAMFNDKGKRIKTAGPSTPVMVLGLSGAPQAGEKFRGTDSEQEARQIATKRAQIEREQTNRASKRISLDEIGRRLALGTFKELNLIVKGDVDGSIEALSDSLIKLSVETIQVNVIHKAVGQIVESDVLLASASDAIIIGFQVRPSSAARQLAEKEGVEIKTYSIIYEAIEEVKMAMEGMLEPTREEKILGTAEVRETFKISKVGTIAGCYVTEGKILKNNFVRLIREGIVVFPTREGANGEIGNLKRFKDDVKEVKNGMECGITIKNYNDIKAGDVIEAYEIIEVKQTLD
ncbi:MAG TPA: translation initiation factor IF-2 [Saprospiraceae bacterium]|mgnify:FL=1|nr:translation initiation factor IF-2 [Lewinellaceae bacterium]HPQ20480.1 translation initiation factor IF-2 [Saprospiraceae bacterium]